MQNEHDEAVDRVLKALRDATPPEGMATRIAERLQHPASVPSPTPRWRDAVAGSTTAGAWWRGAFSGAAAAMVVAAAGLFVAHVVQPRPHAESPVAAAHSIAAVAPAAPSPVVEKVVVERRSGPCATPSVLREKEATTTPTHKLETLLAESVEPSFPAPAMPLTAQERRLLRLAQKADPKQLGALDPVAQAKADAEGAAEFDQFFAPPSPPKIEDDAKPTENMTDKKGEL